MTNISNRLLFNHVTQCIVLLIERKYFLSEHIYRMQTCSIDEHYVKKDTCKRVVVSLLAYNTFDLWEIIFEVSHWGSYLIVAKCGQCIIQQDIFHRIRYLLIIMLFL